MTSSLQALPLSALHDRLQAAVTEIEARSLIAVDGSGNVIEMAGVLAEHLLPTLAALGAGNLAATHEISQLAGIEADTNSPQTLLIEGQHGAVILAEGRQSMNFIAVLSANSLVGLARLEMRRLAAIEWTEPEEAQPDRGRRPIDIATELMNNLDLDF